MSGDGGRLESLHGVNRLLLDKLEGAGIHSVSDLATKTASELLEDYYSNYDEDTRGIDEERISNLVMRAKRKLIEVGFVRITGTFYDANNKVVGTAYTFTQPEDLLSGDIAPFDLILMYSSISAKSRTLQNNQIGIFFTGADLAIVLENIAGNNNIAVATNIARGINVISNVMNTNSLAGVTFGDTDNSAVNSNNIKGSQNAVFLDSQNTNNTVQLNNAHDNVVDVNNANGLAPTINQNTFSDNNCDVSISSGLCLGR